MTTATVDDKKRVRIPAAKPGQVFSVEPEPNGSIRLVPVVRQTEVPAAKVRFIKKHGYTVAVGDRPITHEQVRALMDEFP